MKERVDAKLDPTLEVASLGPALSPLPLCAPSTSIAHPSLSPFCSSRPRFRIRPQRAALDTRSNMHAGLADETSKRERPQAAGQRGDSDGESLLPTDPRCCPEDRAGRRPGFDDGGLLRLRRRRLRGRSRDMLLELQGWRETTPRAKVSTQRGRCARLTDAADPKGRV
jgi:hypothetical protein